MFGLANFLVLQSSLCVVQFQLGDPLGSTKLCDLIVLDLNLVLQLVSLLLMLGGILCGNNSLVLLQLQLVCLPHELDYEMMLCASLLCIAFNIVICIIQSASQVPLQTC